MSNADLLVIIGLAAAVLTAIAALVTAIKSLLELQHIHKEINGRLNEMLRLTKNAAFAAGRKEEQDFPSPPPPPRQPGKGG